MVQPGDVHYCDMPYPDGKTWKSKDRPMLVVAVYGQGASQVALMVMVTSSPKRVADAAKYGNVPVANWLAAGLTQTSVTMPKRLLTLDTNALGKRIGHVDSAHLAQVKAKVRQFLSTQL
jgi:mRNA-degrading endonuclease toxin of MazEF toxin-antitoxin module